MVQTILGEIAEALQLGAGVLEATFTERSRDACDKLLASVGEPHLQTGLRELYENIEYSAQNRWLA